MSAVDELRSFLAKGGVTGKQADALLARYDAAALGIRQQEHEDDLERARLASYQIGVLTVVETFRSRLQATAGVPSREALLAFMRTMERTEGGKPFEANPGG